MLSNLNIRSKLIIGFGSIVLCMIAISWFLLDGLHSTHTTAQDVRVQQVQELAMEEGRFFTTQGHLWFEEIMGGDTTESVDECYELWKKTIQNCNLIVDGGTYEGAVYKPTENAAVKADIERARELLGRLIEIGRERYTDFKSGAGNAGVGSSNDEKFDAVYTDIMNALESARKEQTASVKRGGDMMTSEYSRRRITAFIMVAVVLALGTALALAISKRIARPIRNLEAASNRVAEGDWSHTITVESDDELGALARSFNAMTEHLRLSDERAKQYLKQQVSELLLVTERFADGDLTARAVVVGDDEIAQLSSGFNSAVEQVGSVFESVVESSETTAVATEQISNVMQQIADTARELSALITDISASVEEMAYTITENAQNAGQTVATAETGGEIAKRGGVQVQNTLEQMRVITDVIQQSVTTVERLGQSSTQIGEIVMVINDIADQTNLLALNAAIEAARAGESGRGFAVVADEVRKLAERTAKATREIETMIKQIQQETSAAVIVMRRGKEEVSHGMEMAGRAGGELQEIIEGSVEMQRMVGQIATASLEQSQVANLIARGVETVNEKTAQTTSAIMHIVPMIEELTNVTSVLQQRVEQFNLVDSHDAAHSSVRRRKANKGRR